MRSRNASHAAVAQAGVAPHATDAEQPQQTDSRPNSTLLGMGVAVADPMTAESSWHAAQKARRSSQGSAHGAAPTMARLSSSSFTGQGKRKLDSPVATIRSVGSTEQLNALLAMGRGGDTLRMETPSEALGLSPPLTLDAMTSPLPGIQESHAFLQLNNRSQARVSVPGGSSWGGLLPSRESSLMFGAAESQLDAISQGLEVHFSGLSTLDPPSAFSGAARPSFHSSSGKGRSISDAMEMPLQREHGSGNQRLLKLNAGPVSQHHSPQHAAANLGLDTRDRAGAHSSSGAMFFFDLEVEDNDDDAMTALDADDLHLLDNVMFPNLRTASSTYQGKADTSQRTMLQVSGQHMQQQQHSHAALGPAAKISRTGSAGRTSRSSPLPKVDPQQLQLHSQRMQHFYHLQQLPRSTHPAAAHVLQRGSSHGQQPAPHHADPCLFARLPGRSQQQMQGPDQGHGQGHARGQPHRLHTRLSLPGYDSSASRPRQGPLRSAHSQMFDHFQHDGLDGGALAGGGADETDTLMMDMLVGDEHPGEEGDVLGQLPRSSHGYLPWEAAGGGSRATGAAHAPHAAAGSGPAAASGGGPGPGAAVDTRQSTNGGGARPPGVSAFASGAWPGGGAAAAAAAGGRLTRSPSGSGSGGPPAPAYEAGAGAAGGPALSRMPDGWIPVPAGVLVAAASAPGSVSGPPGQGSRPSSLSLLPGSGGSITGGGGGYGRTTVSRSGSGLSPRGGAAGTAGPGSPYTHPNSSHQQHNSSIARHNGANAPGVGDVGPAGDGAADGAATPSGTPRAGFMGEDPAADSSSLDTAGGAGSSGSGGRLRLLADVGPAAFQQQRSRLSGGGGGGGGEGGRQSARQRQRAVPSRREPAPKGRPANAIAEVGGGTPGSGQPSPAVSPHASAAVAAATIAIARAAASPGSGPSWSARDASTGGTAAAGGGGAAAAAASAAALAAAAQGKARSYNRTVPSFADIVRLGLFQPGRVRLTVGNIKDEVEVDVTPGGDIVHEGMAFPSISAFALVVLRSRNAERQACDGWKEVRFNGGKMEVLRKECLQKMFELGEL